MNSAEPILAKDKVYIHSLQIAQCVLFQRRCRDSGASTTTHIPTHRGGCRVSPASLW